MVVVKKGIQLVRSIVTHRCPKVDKSSLNDFLSASFGSWSCLMFSNALFDASYDNAPGRL